jgi:hypothetical protein
MTRRVNIEVSYPDEDPACQSRICIQAMPVGHGLDADDVSRWKGVASSV